MSDVFSTHIGSTDEGVRVSLGRFGVMGDTADHHHGGAGATQHLKKTDDRHNFDAFYQP